ncbi:MAG TPA: hypothetical protein PLZ93_06190 [Nocardioides sp.]|uniref:hypothetical protein n=1 Tax=uncultured Nocardioides sp. TaxID=198441 RepID=UPI00263A3CAE|nr:hypothetical protein [uncultured Nocardioides sp.]HRD61675.1 hypothetical protein [Nocardioides sp.]HRI95181.1 hypothetical protein [Nocardioides sp.]HRK45612.1 hypothetical protein [Nocardioides sp.]
MTSISEPTGQPHFSGAQMDPYSAADRPNGASPESGSHLSGTAAQHSEWRRNDAFIPDLEATPDSYPTLRNMSAAFMFSGVVRPIEPTEPEYVALSLDPALGSEENIKALVAVSKWNTLWEAGPFRRRFFDEEELPEPMASIADLGDINVTFVPRTRSRYYEYAPMLHLLPRQTMERFGLPVLRGCLWPFLAEYNPIDEFLPADFEARLSRAWAYRVWRHLDAGSKMHSFTRNDPIKLLAHNLDFWVPAVTATIQSRLREFPEVDKGKDPSELGVPVTLEDGSILPGAITGQPRMGGTVWIGEEEADIAVEDAVGNADRTGRLRDIMDAVRSHRIEDDFSDYWSFAREDFERKLYGKRRKVKVTFVEVPDTSPVQSAESEVVGDLVTNDFLAMLDVRNRQIVVLLNSGATRTEIAEILGYANHSAISKRLSQIRATAEAFFDQS